MKQKYRQISIKAIVALLWSPSVSAWTIVVREKGSGIPIKRAEAKCRDDVVLSDGEGLIDLQVYGEVTISRSGYYSETIQVDAATSPGKVEVYLRQKISDDETIVIRGEKRKEVSKKVISIDESKKVSPGGDPARVAQLLPGVQSQPFSPEIIVRGSGPNDSLYLIDNLYVPYIFHRIGDLSVLPEDMLQEVEFSSGGFSSRYGDATGGVVTLRTKDEHPDRNKTVVRVNLPVYSGVYHERKLSDDSSLGVSLRRSYLDAVVRAVMASNPNAKGSTVVPVFADASARYLKTGDQSRNKVLALYSQDGLKLLVPADIADNPDGTVQVNIDSRYVKLGWEHSRSLSSDWRLELTPQIGYFQSDQQFFSNYVNLEFSTWGLTTELSRRLDSQRRLVLGMEPIFAKGDIAVKVKKDNPDDPFFDFEEAEDLEISYPLKASALGVWAEWDQAVGPLIVRPGVRWQHDGVIRRQVIDPRLSVRWPLPDGHLLKFAMGQYSKRPEDQESAKTYGNPDLDFTRSYHTVLGLETEWGKEWKTDLQLFHKRTIDEVTFHPTRRFDNEGSSRSRGFELFLRRNPGQRWFGWISYTFSKTEVRDSDSKPFEQAQYDQTHVLNCVGNYRLNETWDLGGRVGYHTGDTYEEVGDAYYKPTYDKYQPLGSSVRKKRLPSFHQIDIFGNKEFLADTWTLGLRFGIQFLALKPQIFGMGYSYDYAKKEPVEGIPPIPYLAATATF